jgi:hypothetical protein
MTQDISEPINIQALTSEQRAGYSKVMLLNDEFERSIISDTDNRARNQDNWKLYAGIDFQQWSATSLTDAIMEGRYLNTYNITTQKVDSLAGAILKNPFDSDFVPVEAGDAQLTYIAKEKYLADKELTDWESSYQELVTGGLVYEGVEEMYIDRRYDPLGTIAWRTNLPGHVVFDRTWKTVSGKDCLKAYKVCYLMPGQILALYPNARDILWPEVQRNLNFGDTFDSMAQGILPNFDLMQGDGDPIRVILCYRLVDMPVWEDYDEMTGLVLPNTNDLAVKVAFLNRTNDRWSPTKVKSRQVMKRICIRTDILPDHMLDRPLLEKKTEIQVGRLPFFPWSAARINGVPRGIVDLIRDIQRNINSSEAWIDYIIQTQSNPGQLFDPLLFNNEEPLINNFIKNSNNPGAKIRTASGAMGRIGKPESLAKNSYPTETQQKLLRMWDYADRLSKAPAVSDARTEGTGESGYLFAQKTRIAEQQQYVLFAGLKRHQGEKGEAWLTQGKTQYSHGGFQRPFMSKDGKKVMFLNQRIPTPDGGETVINDFSQLPRHRVTITESPSGVTNRLITRSTATETMKVIPPESLGTRQVLATAITETLDGMDEKQRQELKEFGDLEKEQAKETLKANIEKLKLIQLQTKEQIKLTLNPPPPTPPIIPGAGGGAGMAPAGTPAMAGPGMG